MNISKGYKLVPVEPTTEMLAVDTVPLLCLGSPNTPRVIQWRLGLYTSMLAAAPAPPQPIYEEALDRVTAERDAALAELGRYQSLFNQAQKAIDRLNELHRKRMAEIGRRLTAADERADVLEELLREVEAACDLAMSAIDHDERGANFVRIIAAIKAKAVPKRSDELVAQHAAIDFFDAALKPAEGGGDE